MGLLRQFFMVVLLLNLSLIFLPNIPPFDVDFEEIHLEKLRLVGEQRENDRLDHFERLSHEIQGIGRLKGPESYDHKDGYLYSGVSGGDIIRLDLSNVSKPWEAVFHYGATSCEHAYDLPKCGRPLGISFDSKGHLVIADAYLGVYRVDLENNKAETLVAADQVVDGKVSKLTDAVAVAKDGTVFYSVSSTKYALHELLLILVEYSTPTGRLMKYDPKTRTNTVLVENLIMTNGLCLSRDEDFLVFSDTGKPKLLKYHLKGTKKGTVEEFAKTPGLTDNIKPNGKGGFIAAHIIPTFEGGPHVALVDILKYPLLTRYINRIIWNIKVLVQYVNNSVLETSVGKLLDYYIANAEPVSKDKYGFLAEYDSEGKPIRSWQSPTSKVAGLSEGFLHKGYLYLGSFTSQQVLRVKY